MRSHLLAFVKDFDHGRKNDLMNDAMFSILQSDLLYCWFQQEQVILLKEPIFIIGGNRASGSSWTKRCPSQSLVMLPEGSYESPCDVFTVLSSADETADRPNLVSILPQKVHVHYLVVVITVL